MKLVTPQHIKSKSRKVVLIILRSLDGEDNWEPVMPKDLPKFVSRPDIIRRLVDGEMCQLESQSPYWFRGEEQVVH